MDRGLDERALAVRTSARCEKMPFRKAVLREPKLRKRNRSQQSMRPQRRHTQTGLEARLKTLKSQRIPIRQRVNRWRHIEACRKATRPCNLGMLTVRARPWCAGLYSAACRASCPMSCGDAWHVETAHAHNAQFHPLRGCGLELCTKRTIGEAPRAE